MRFALSTIFLLVDSQVYPIEDIKQMSGMSRYAAYRFANEVSQKQPPFDILKVNAL